MKAIIKFRDGQEFTCHNLAKIIATSFNNARFQLDDSAISTSKSWESDYSTFRIIDDASYLFDGNEKICVRGSDLLAIKLMD